MVIQRLLACPGMLICVYPSCVLSSCHYSIQAVLYGSDTQTVSLCRVWPTIYYLLRVEIYAKCEIFGSNGYEYEFIC
jgi:hypothetical protein